MSSIKNLLVPLIMLGTVSAIIYIAISISLYYRRKNEASVKFDKEYIKETERNAIRYMDSSTNDVIRHMDSINNIYKLETLLTIMPDYKINKGDSFLYYSRLSSECHRLFMKALYKYKKDPCYKYDIEMQKQINRGDYFIKKMEEFK